ncbi:MAG: hypothetical protein ACTSRU_05440 [Candidatus Hodarchaeales archaeon]
MKKDLDLENLKEIKETTINALRKRVNETLYNGKAEFTKEASFDEVKKAAEQLVDEGERHIDDTWDTCTREILQNRISENRGHGKVPTYGDIRNILAIGKKLDPRWGEEPRVNKKWICKSENCQNVSMSGFKYCVSCRKKLRELDQRTIEVEMPDGSIWGLRELDQRTIEVEMPDGSIWGVPVKEVLMNRTLHYSEREEFEEDSEEWIEEMKISDDEILEWAEGNMDWDDVSDKAIKIKDPPALTLRMMREGWMNGEKRITGEL